MKISELNMLQRKYLAYRLYKTIDLSIKYVIAVAYGEWGNIEVVTAYMRAGRTERSAKIQEKKVLRCCWDLFYEPS
jgi:hypothetical protein